MDTLAAEVRRAQSAATAAVKQSFSSSENRKFHWDFGTKEDLIKLLENVIDTTELAYKIFHIYLCTANKINCLLLWY